MTLFHLLAEGTGELERSGDPDAQTDARQLLLAAFHLDMTHFLLDRMQEMEENDSTASCTALFRNMIEKRKKRVPVQQILNSQDFMGLTFYVNEHVLIPRQDTETLVELVLDEQKDRTQRLLDLCTGTGCIAVSLAVKGGYAFVAATDISEEALKVARRNAKELTDGSPGQRVEFFRGDLFAALDAAEKFDIITANPPYIPTEVIGTLEPEVREHEPMLALDGSDDGLLFYRRLAAEAGNYLNADGAVYLEIGYDQGAAVSGLLKEAGFKEVRVCKDLAGKDRVVCGTWPADQ